MAFAGVLLSLSLCLNHIKAISVTVGDVTTTSPLTGNELKVLLTDDVFTCSAALEFDDSSNPWDLLGNLTLMYSVVVNGETADEGSMLIAEFDVWPSEVTSSELTVSTTGDVDIVIKAWFQDLEAESTASSPPAVLFCITGFTTMVPLIFVVLFALTLKNVYVSLCMAIWIGSFIISGCSFRFAFELSVGEYIVNSAASADHQYVILFTVFLSGLVFLVQRSGGTRGFSTLVSALSKNGRRTQWACFLLGLIFLYVGHDSSVITFVYARCTVSTIMPTR